mmetsp:Transcript_97339/g.275114  ORF Transcript_97339/g.275114 Transcript_97339/m.275114 type:complete len:285 (+) Transcript_97339:586-1440(+)
MACLSCDLAACTVRTPRKHTVCRPCSQKRRFRCTRYEATLRQSAAFPTPPTPQITTQRDFPSASTTRQMSVCRPTVRSSLGEICAMLPSPRQQPCNSSTPRKAASSVAPSVRAASHALAGAQVSSSHTGPTLLLAALLRSLDRPPSSFPSHSPAATLETTAAGAKPSAGGGKRATSWRPGTSSGCSANLVQVSGREPSSAHRCGADCGARRGAGWGTPQTCLPTSCSPPPLAATPVAAAPSRSPSPVLPSVPQESSVLRPNASPVCPAADCLAADSPGGGRSAE